MHTVIWLSLRCKHITNTKIERYSLKEKEKEKIKIKIKDEYKYIYKTKTPSNHCHCGSVDNLHFKFNLIDR